MQKNKAQEQAIETIDGQLLLISCPGSGKTTTMIRRIKHMIEEGITPSSILMVTFTDAAAKEMQERFGVSEAAGPTFCTIHALCRRILLDSGEMPRIIPAAEQYRMIKDALYEQRIRVSDQKDVLNDISAFKNSTVPLDKFYPMFLGYTEFKTVYEEYERLKKNAGYVDFDDLLTLCYQILQKDSRLLSKWKQTYRYIMCDEYQDTNNIQKCILYLLAGTDGNFCVVGDDDQSIYGFRGANPKIMSDFQKDFPKATLIRMDTNYRSCPEIIKYARNLIEHNRQRFAKDIMAFRTDEGKVIFHASERRGDELKYVASQIHDLIADGQDSNTMAILTRTNQQLDDMAALLEDYKIPYYCSDRVPDIHEHFIFQDVMSYLRVIDGSYSREDILNILNKPARYLKESDFKRVTVFSESVLLEAQRYSSQKQYGQERYIKKLCQNIENLKRRPLFEQVEGIASQIGYRNYLSSFAKKADLDESILLSKLDGFIMEARRYQTLNEWNAFASFCIRRHADEQANRKKNGVTLSTMHRSKGLEWNTVFLLDCCAGIIPSAKSKNGSKTDLEEERRLFYVAATRAKNRLYVLNYISKSQSGRQTSSAVYPSIFIDEMKKSPTEKQDAANLVPDVKKAQDAHSTGSFVEGSPQMFRVGMTVHHSTFGEGTVVSKNMLCVNIRFKDGSKIFPLRR